MKKKLTLAFLLFLGFSILSFGQCKHFAKKDALPALKPYTVNGHLNYAVLKPGQAGNINVSFMPNVDYRIVVAVPEKLKGAIVKITDKKGDVIYDNKKPALINKIDIETKNALALKIHFEIPKANQFMSIPPSGCAVVLIGFKK